MITKQELRKQIRALKKQYTPGQLLELSRPVVQQLEQHPDFVNAHVVMAYYSLPDEVDTHELLRRHPDKTFILPVVQGDDLLLKVFDPAQGMRMGALHVEEPDTDQLFTDFDKIDTVMVPGMAFDANGTRMGRGRGYYDRFLSKIPRARRLGLCFPFQFVDAVPCEPFDIPMHAVIAGR